MNSVEVVSKPKGHFKIEVLDANGNVKDTFEQNNLVVNSSRPILAQHMAGRNVVPINKLVLGTRGHIDDNLMAPKTAAEGFTSAREQLFAEEESKFVYNISFSPGQDNGPAVVNEDNQDAGSTVEIIYANNTITYKFVVAVNAANGETGTVAYTEAGMYAGNDLFCMRTFAVRSKDVSSVLRITWTLIF